MAPYVFDANDGEFAEFAAYIINLGRVIPDNVQEDCREVDIVLPDINLASITWLLRSVSSYQSEQSFRDNLLLPLAGTIIGPNAYPQNPDVVNNRKAIDIRQLYWVLRLLKVMSNMANWRITSPPNDAFTTWVYDCQWY